MEKIPYFAGVRKWWWLILLAILLAGGGRYWIESRKLPTYMTSATIQVGQFIETFDPRIGDLNTSQQLAQIYAQSVRRQPLLQATIDALDLDIGWETLALQVNASAFTGTQLIKIYVVDTDPMRAKIIAEELANQLILQSPSSQEQEQEQRRQFVSQQLAGLEKNIATAERQIGELDGAIVRETSAVRIKDLQNRVASLQQSISNWQANYSRLLDFLKGGRTNYLRLIERPSVPQRPIGPNIPIDVIVTASIGLLLALGSVLVIEYLDDTLHTAEEVNNVLALPTLGSVMKASRAPRSIYAPIAVREPDSPISEEYRFIRTNIRFALGNGAPIMLLVTSPSPGEGKTTTAANLAVSFAQSGKRVVVVDADLRHPSIGTMFGISTQSTSSLPQFGLTSLLLDESFQAPEPEQADDIDTIAWERRVIGNYLVGSGIDNLFILPAGPPTYINPVELLGSFQMQRLLTCLKKMADVIILDSAPVVPLADVATLVAMGAGVILVIEVGKTRSQAARLAKETLVRVRSRIIGVVLNKAPRNGADYYGYYRRHQDFKKNGHITDGREKRMSKRELSADTDASAARRTVK